MLNAKVVEMKEEMNGVRVRIEGAEIGGDESVYEKVLVAVGREPNSGGLGLEKTKVIVDARGFVQVDAARRTAEPAIYAIYAIPPVTAYAPTLRPSGSCTMAVMIEP